jgi:RNA polymerase sigma-70 factor (ECF subfamily)
MMLGNKTNASAPEGSPDEDSRFGFAVSSPLTFRTVYEQYLDFVWSSVRHLGVGAEWVEDVVQDVFIVIHAKLPTLRQPEALRSWIYGIARRVVSDHRKSSRSRNAASTRLGAEIDLRSPIQLSPHEIAERNGELDLLERVLARLDEPRREIFVMVEFLEMTVPEVAQALDIPLSSAYSRLRVARELFEQTLARQRARNEKD